MNCKKNRATYHTRTTMEELMLIALLCGCSCLVSCCCSGYVGITFKKCGVMSSSSNECYKTMW